MKKKNHEQEQSKEKIDNKLQDQNKQFQIMPLVRQSSFNKHQELFTTQQQKSNSEFLFNGHRFYKKSTWSPQIKQNYIDSNYEVVQIELHYGYFATKINVINLQISYGQQQVEEDKIIGSGTFGRVEICRLKDESVAVKLVKIQQKKQTFSSLENVYQQYFIALIASQLGLGPKIIDIFGCQIVFLHNYAMFGMQICLTIQPQTFINKSHNDEIFQRMKKSLNILHSLHIVHRDLKPQNILWSPYFKKQVFIDFGLSLIICQNKGQKTYTSFAGSFTYCSPQMRKCFILTKSRQVDLYQNDLYSLSKVKNYFLLNTPYKNSGSNKIIKQCKYKFSKSQYFLQALAQIISVKKNLFLKNYQGFFNLFNNCQYSLRTCMQICSKIIKQQNFSPKKEAELKQWQDSAKKKIIQQKFQISNVDKILFNYFQSKNTKNAISFVIPLTSSLQNQLNNLYRWINDQMWLSRIFFLLNYFRDQDTRQVPNFQEIVIFIVNKLYQHIQGQNTKIFMKKIRRILLFFRDKFQQFRNTKFLYLLIDLFEIIGDRLSMVKIREKTLQFQEDPLLYCLHNLLFYILDQRNTNFYFGISIHYLLNIEAIIKQSQLKSNPECCQLLLTITQQFLNFSLDTDEKQIDLLKQILGLIQKLLEVISLNNSQYTEFVKKIKIKFQKLLINFIKDTYALRDLNQEIRVKLKKNGLNLIHKTINQQCQQYVSVISLKQFYWHERKRELQKFQCERDKEKLKQYLQFYFQMSYFKIQTYNSDFCQVLYKKCYEEPYLLEIILKQKLKCIKNFMIQYILKPSIQICNEIVNIKRHVLLIKFVQQKNKDLKFKSQRDIIGQILIQLKQIIKNYIKDQHQQSLLLLCIQIVELINFNQIYCPQQIIILLRQYYLKIKELSKSDNNVELYVRRSFLEILSQILKSNYFIKKIHINELQTIIFQAACIKNTYYEILYIHNFFQLYIKIVHKMLQQQIGTDIITDAIIFCIKNQEQKPQNFIVKANVSSGIKSFVSYYNHRQVLYFLIHFRLHEPEKFNLLISNNYGCYFFFILLQNCDDSFKKSIFARQYLFKIAVCLSRSHSIIKIEILKTYFEYFIAINKKKPRKLLICQRSQFRYNQKFKFRSEYSFKRIDKKLHKWPHKISRTFEQKINLGFASD